MSKHYKKFYYTNTSQYCYHLNQACYKTKKHRKIFPYILVEEYYFISLQQEREGM